MLKKEHSQHKKDMASAKQLLERLKAMKAEAKDKLKRKQGKKPKTTTQSPPSKRKRPAKEAEKTPPTPTNPKPQETQAQKPQPKPTPQPKKEEELQGKGKDMIIIEEKTPQKPTEKKDQLELKISEKEKVEIEGKSAPLTPGTSKSAPTTTTTKLDTTSPFYEERRKVYRFVAASHAPYHPQQRQLCDDTHRKLELCRDFNTGKCSKKQIAHSDQGNPKRIVTHFCELCIHALMVPQAHPANECPVSRKRRAAQREAAEKQPVTSK